MNTGTFYSTNVHVDLRDVDFSKKMKVSSLFSYFQDVASLAANELGYGIERLSEQFGVAWVLMRIRVEIKRMPSWDEDVVIETWPLEPKRVEFERDYLVYDKDGNTIIRATSVWVVMDMNERRLKRADTIGIHYPDIIQKRAIEAKLGKLSDYGHLQLAYQKVIGYSDIDFNGHLNNSKYVDYIMDCFPMEDHQTYNIKTIEVNFINEALPGHTISLHKDLSSIHENKVFIEGINKSNEKTVFKAQVEIEKIQ